MQTSCMQPDVKVCVAGLSHIRESELLYFISAQDVTASPSLPITTFHYICMWVCVRVQTSECLVPN